LFYALSNNVCTTIWERGVPLKIFKLRFPYYLEETILPTALKE